MGRSAGVVAIALIVLLLAGMLFMRGGNTIERPATTDGGVYGGDGGGAPTEPGTQENVFERKDVTCEPLPFSENDFEAEVKFMKYDTAHMILLMNVVIHQKHGGYIAEVMNYDYFETIDNQVWLITEDGYVIVPEYTGIRQFLPGSSDIELFIVIGTGRFSTFPEGMFNRSMNRFSGYFYPPKLRISKIFIRGISASPYKVCIAKGFRPESVNITIPLKETYTVENPGFFDTLRVVYPTNVVPGSIDEPKYTNNTLYVYLSSMMSDFERYLGDEESFTGFGFTVIGDDGQIIGSFEPQPIMPKGGRGKAIVFKMPINVPKRYLDGRVHRFALYPYMEVGGEVVYYPRYFVIPVSKEIIAVSQHVNLYPEPPADIIHTPLPPITWTPEIIPIETSWKKEGREYRYFYSHFPGANYLPYPERDSVYVYAVDGGDIVFHPKYSTLGNEYELGMSAHATRIGLDLKVFHGVVGFPVVVQDHYPNLPYYSISFTMKYDKVAAICSQASPPSYNVGGICTVDFKKELPYDFAVPNFPDSGQLWYDYFYMESSDGALRVFEPGSLKYSFPFVAVGPLDSWSTSRSIVWRLPSNKMFAIVPLGSYSVRIDKYWELAKSPTTAHPWVNVYVIDVTKESDKEFLTRCTYRYLDTKTEFKVIEPSPYYSRGNLAIPVMFVEEKYIHYELDRYRKSGLPIYVFVPHGAQLLDGKIKVDVGEKMTFGVEDMKMVGKAGPRDIYAVYIPLPDPRELISLDIELKVRTGSTGTQMIRILESYRVSGYVATLAAIEKFGLVDSFYLSDGDKFFVVTHYDTLFIYNTLNRLEEKTGHRVHDSFITNDNSSIILPVELVTIDGKVYAITKFVVAYNDADGLRYGSFIPYKEVPEFVSGIVYEDEGKQVVGVLDKSAEELGGNVEGDAYIRLYPDGSFEVVAYAGDQPAVLGETGHGTHFERKS